MDDKRLQQEFDEYFTASNLPENMTADAKAHVKARKREGLFKWVRLVPVAAVTILLIVGVSFMMNRFSTPGSSTGSDNSAERSEYTYYSSASLTSLPLDPYSAGKIEGLEFAEELAVTCNASIRLTGFRDDEGKLVYAQADVSMLHGGYRHDTVIYAEYTDEYVCLEDLKDYLTGSTSYYRGNDYVINTEFDDGENVYKIYLNTGKVKYYISVMTSEEYGYRYYLNFLKNI